jgi:hypothetical protein
MIITEGVAPVTRYRGFAMLVFDWCRELAGCALFETNGSVIGFNHFYVAIAVSSTDMPLSSVTLPLTILDFLRFVEDCFMYYVLVLDRQQEETATECNVVYIGLDTLFQVLI